MSALATSSVSLWRERLFGTPFTAFVTVVLALAIAWVAVPLVRWALIDATFRGNVSRFINHTCDPNLEVQKWYVKRLPRLGLFALDDILPGPELSYNYRVKWFGKSLRDVQQCHCGAANCRGEVLGRLFSPKPALCAPIAA